MNLRRTIATLLAALMLLALTACGAGTTSPAQDANDPAEETAPSTTESSQLRVGMECAYAPSNWQESAATDTNVPVENVAGAYAEGYDVQIARILADQLDHASSFLVYARLYTAHLISAESSVTSIRSINCAATIFFSSKLNSEKTSLSGMAGLDFSRLRDSRISSRSFSRRASAR